MGYHDNKILSDEEIKIKTCEAGEREENGKEEWQKRSFQYIKIGFSILFNNSSSMNQLPLNSPSCLRECWVIISQDNKNRDELPRGDVS